MFARFRRLLVQFTALTAMLLGVDPTRLTPQRGPNGVAQAAQRRLVLPAAPTPPSQPAKARAPARRISADAASRVVLTRSASWFVYPKGCDALKDRFDLVVHFHGAHSTVIPRYLASNLNAVLVIINKGIGSGAYSEALALQSQVDDLMSRIHNMVAQECAMKPRPHDRLALSSWSAGYGAIQQFLRLRPKSADAVLLSDGLHVGFSDERRRKVRASQMQEFVSFARRAAQGQVLMAVTHSAITPPEYASAAETAMVLAEAAGAPSWPLERVSHGMTQLTQARRGQFFVDGFAGNDKAAHAGHLYSIGQTSFARLKSYWAR